MPSAKMNISLERSVADTLRRRASETGSGISGYIAGLVREDDERVRDRLAAEGYRLLSADTADWADAALPIAAQAWPEWRTEKDDAPTAR